MTAVVVERVEHAPLTVPLVEPFTIATATMTTTRAALVRVTVRTPSGATAIGMGEAAALPGVTSEDQPDLLAAVANAASALAGAQLTAVDELPAIVAAAVSSRVAAAGLEAAILDAWGRAVDVPVHALLVASDPAPPAPPTHALRTDVTLPIAAPEHMADLARAWWQRGFSVFKVKVGRDLDDDVRALASVHAAVPDASFRLDANCGYEAHEALALLHETARRGLVVECFEQPCARDDLDGMAEVTRATAVPVVADESVRDLADLRRVVARRAASAINVKLAKTGSLVAARALARAARAEGLGLMCGAMVETRLGLTAMAHVVIAASGADWIDLDTALLLAADPFRGGYELRGDVLHVTRGAGLDVTTAT